jgi:hypothetical protein
VIILPKAFFRRLRRSVGQADELVLDAAVSLRESVNELQIEFVLSLHVISNQLFPHLSNARRLGFLSLPSHHDTLLIPFFEWMNALKPCF